MKVGGDLSKTNTFCLRSPFIFHEKKKHMFGTTQGWVNHDKSFIFEWTVP